MKPTVLALTAAALLSQHLAFAAEPADSLRACRALPDAITRLACYDAVPLPAPVPPIAAAPAVRAAPPVAAVPAAVPVATSAAPTPKPAESQFGLEDQRAAQQQDISSAISGLFEGWGPSSRFKLDNGQVWQIADGSSASYYLRSPKVKVTRAVLGGFRLEITGANQAPRVRRVE